MTNSDTSPAKHGCSEYVFRRGQPIAASCYRTAVVLADDGKWYCRQHDPDAVRQRRDESHARADAEWAAYRTAAKQRKNGEEMLAILRERGITDVAMLRSALGLDG